MFNHIHPIGNSLTLLLPNDAIWHQDLCELSISLWEFIWGFVLGVILSSTGFLLLLAVMGCKELKKQKPCTKV